LVSILNIFIEEIWSKSLITSPKKIVFLCFIYFSGHQFLGRWLTVTLHHSRPVRVRGITAHSSCRKVRTLHSQSPQKNALFHLIVHTCYEPASNHSLCPEKQDALNYLIYPHSKSAQEMNVQPITTEWLGNPWGSY
jgi:hypothetical protein